MGAPVALLHQPISHLPQQIHIWEATAQACQVPDHKVQVRKDKIKTMKRIPISIYLILRTEVYQ